MICCILKPGQNIFDDSKQKVKRLVLLKNDSTKEIKWIFISELTVARQRLKTLYWRVHLGFENDIAVLRAIYSSKST